jgi:hypothetical protein
VRVAFALRLCVCVAFVVASVVAFVWNYGLLWFN